MDGNKGKGGRENYETKPVGALFSIRPFVGDSFIICPLGKSPAVDLQDKP